MWRSIWASAASSPVKEAHVLQSELTVHSPTHAEYANSESQSIVIHNEQLEPQVTRLGSTRIFSPRLPVRQFLAPWLIASICLAISVLFFHHEARLSEDDTLDTFQFQYYDIRYNYIAQMLTFTLGVVFLMSSLLLFAAPILLRKKAAAKLVFDEAAQEVLIQKVWFCRLGQIMRCICVRCRCPAASVQNCSIVPDSILALISEKRFPMSCFAGSNVVFEHDILNYGDVRARWEVKFIVKEGTERSIKAYVLDETISKAGTAEIAEMIDLNLAVIEYWERQGRRSLMHNLELPDLPSLNENDEALEMEISMDQNSVHWNNRHHQNKTGESEEQARERGDFHKVSTSELDDDENINHS